MWLDEKISFYECAADNQGAITTYREILLTRFAVPHNFYYKVYPEDTTSYPKGKWVNGMANDLDTIIKIRTEQVSKSEQAVLKQTMQCFTPAGLLKSKKKGSIEEINRTGIMQLDFDYNDILDYDVEELKQCVFSLDFIAFSGLSCSGKGFYALALISEPYKLNEYAEHCFNILLDYGIKADTTKGRNVNDLRFVSYDSNMLIRENPKPLLIKRFKSKSKPAIRQTTPKLINDNTGSNLIKSELKKLQTVQVGSRWATVQQVAYTLGGLNDNHLLQTIKDIINTNSAFMNEEIKYSKCAEDCFTAGTLKPLNQ